MQLALYFFWFVCLFELMIYFPFVWRFKQLASAILIILIVITSLVLVGRDSSYGYLGIMFLSLYRVINLQRVIKGRTQLDHLHNSSRIASVYLIGMQVATLLTIYLVHITKASDHFLLYVLAVIQLAVAIGLIAITCKNLEAIKLKVKPTHLSHNDLPTLSVLIPARNETDDLDKCLSSLLTSSYPKLEIIVLDDCSQDKHTPEIIKAFAQKGVRYIPGEIPSDSWLAKNYAYEQLYSQASGEILLFCGVDTYFQPDSLLKIVESMVTTGNDMWSILPANDLSKTTIIKSLLIQPMRYAWEICPPRGYSTRPPVLSTCWLIKKEVLEAAGTFKAVSHSINPESYFSKFVSHGSHGYNFIESDQDIAVYSTKSFQDQKDTALRTRYPQQHKRIELVAAVTLSELYILVWPIISLIIGLVNGLWVLVIINLVGYTLLMATNYKVASLTYRRPMTLSLATLIISSVYDIWLLNSSMWLYEFHEVLWKGRNVCIPVMQILPGLPKS